MRGTHTHMHRPHVLFWIEYNDERLVKRKVYLHQTTDDGNKSNLETYNEISAIPFHIILYTICAVISHKPCYRLCKFFRAEKIENENEALRREIECVYAQYWMHLALYSTTARTQNSVCYPLPASNQFGAVALLFIIIIIVISLLHIVLHILWMQFSIALAFRCHFYYAHIVSAHLRLPFAFIAEKLHEEVEEEELKCIMIINIVVYPTPTFPTSHGAPIHMHQSDVLRAEKVINFHFKEADIGWRFGDVMCVRIYEYNSLCPAILLIIIIIDFDSHLVRIHLVTMAWCEFYDRLS